MDGKWWWRNKEEICDDGSTNRSTTGSSTIQDPSTNTKIILCFEQKDHETLQYWSDVGQEMTGAVYVVPRWQMRDSSSYFWQVSRLNRCPLPSVTTNMATRVKCHLLFIATTFAVLCLITANAPGLPHKRFEYKLSFKGPHLVQKDGTVPFWEHAGRKYSKTRHMVQSRPLNSANLALWLCWPGYKKVKAFDIRWVQCNKRFLRWLPRNLQRGTFAWKSFFCVPEIGKRDLLNRFWGLGLYKGFCQARFRILSIRSKIRFSRCVLFFLVFFFTIIFGAYEDSWGIRCCRARPWVGGDTSALGWGKGLVKP